VGQKFLINFDFTGQKRSRNGFDFLICDELKPWCECLVITKQLCYFTAMYNFYSCSIYVLNIVPLDKRNYIEIFLDFNFAKVFKIEFSMILLDFRTRFWYFLNVYSDFCFFPNLTFSGFSITILRENRWLTIKIRSYLPFNIVILVSIVYKFNWDGSNRWCYICKLTSRHRNCTVYLILALVVTRDAVEAYFLTHYFTKELVSCKEFF
jgi:hypothetical protein